MQLPFSIEDWPADALEDWSERAAIMHFCGRVPLNQAERLAEERVRAEWGRR